MANVPRTGTYLSEDNNFKIQINSANPENGSIEGVYEASYSPQGGFSNSGSIGHYGWVYSNERGQDGVAPFCIRFQASERPSGRPYCIYDTWTGAYQVDNTLLLDGARSYVNNEGVVEVKSLGTLKFSQ